MPWRDAVQEQRARIGDDKIYWELTDADECGRIDVN